VPLISNFDISAVLCDTVSASSSIGDSRCYIACHNDF